MTKYLTPILLLLIAIALIILSVRLLTPTYIPIEDTSADMIIEISDIEANRTIRTKEAIESISRGGRGVYE